MHTLPHFLPSPPPILFQVLKNILLEPSFALLRVAEFPSHALARPPDDITVFSDT